MPGSPEPALAAACQVRPAVAADTVVGARPSYVATPATVAEVAQVLRVAAEAGLTVLPRGLGSKLHWGSPPRSVDLVVDLSGLDQILDHAAGDMVVQAQAGVPMSRLGAVVGETGQQFAIDLPRYDQGDPLAGTVGGVVATAAAGPRRLRYGGPRDLLLGVTMVRADGVVAHSGGRVVKNVAGYDLGKLLCGSYGTLGLIVEATLRLHPVPVQRSYLRAEFPDPVSAAAAAQAVLGSQLSASAVEVDQPTPAGPVALVAQFEGAAAASRAAGAAGLAGGEVASEAPEWFGCRPGSPAGTLVELRAAPTALAAGLGLLESAAEAAGVAVAVRGSAGGLLLHAGLPPAVSAESVASFLATLRAGLAGSSGGSGAPGAPGSAVVVHSPLAAEAIDRWGPVPAGALALMRQVKDQFDPHHRLAPGRFAGGI